MPHSTEPTQRLQHLLGSLVMLALCTAHAQSLSRPELVSALRKGGYVIVMRHASSPGAAPDPAHAAVDNVQHERQLDDAGRSSARAFGEALRRLRIPIGEVLSSPTYRALETIRLAQLGEPKTFSQLGDSGQSMQADPSGVRAKWLREQAAKSPPRGANTFLVTHFPNMREAFGESAAGVADGEALIFHPGGPGPDGPRGVTLIAHVKIGEWPLL
jgi:phosphohistidine phosphatase SixA